MEASEFLKEAQRFCKQYKYCSIGCPLYKKCIFDFVSDSSYEKEILERIENAVATIEQWSKEHPIVTNEMKVREVFGDNAANSILALHPSDIKRWLAEPYKERK